MRFLVDAHLPPALARWLVAAGHQAEHVLDRRMEAASDVAIWTLATELAAVIVTKDEDFAQMKARIGEGPTIVWIRLPNTRRRPLLTWFEQALPMILAACERGETLVELI